MIEGSGDLATGAPIVLSIPPLTLRPHQRSACSTQEKATDAMFVVVSDVHLDKPQVNLVKHYPSVTKRQSSLVW